MISALPRGVVCIAALLLTFEQFAVGQQKPVAVDRKTLSEYVGVYRWNENHFLYVQFWDELGKDQLSAFDESGEARSLYFSATDKFFVGTGVAARSPLEARIVFQRDETGEIKSLSWQSEDGSARVARRVTVFKEQAVSFADGPVRLSGTLTLPTSAAPHPAIVLLHGSGAQDRKGLLPFALFLVRHGVALLSYDKRGVGDSTGDWQRSSFQELADDAIAAVHFLQKQPEIISTRIGVLGVSQSGWIGPLAASRSRDVAFVVSVSGPGETPAQETLTFLQNEMAADGFATSDISQAASLTRTAFQYARTGTGWESYLAERSKSLNTEWFPFMGLSDSKDDPQWQFKRLNNDYDPAPVLRQVQCPVLAFFGGRDLNVTVAKNYPIWEAALKQGRNRDYTLHVVPDGNHILMDAHTGSIVEFPNLKTFDSDYFATLLQWLAVRLPNVQK